MNFNFYFHHRQTLISDWDPTTHLINKVVIYYIYNLSGFAVTPSAKELCIRKFTESDVDDVIWNFAFQNFRNRTSMTSYKIIMEPSGQSIAIIKSWSSRQVVWSLSTCLRNLWWWHRHLRKDSSSDFYYLVRYFLLSIFIYFYIHRKI